MDGSVVVKDQAPISVQKGVVLHQLVYFLLCQMSWDLDKCHLICLVQDSQIK